MGNVAFVFDQVVACVIDYKWAIISVLVGAIILGWIRVGKKWSNVLKVFCAGTFSIVIFDILFNWFKFYSKDSIETLSVGYWNFIILIVSAPVAFAIWHFRDENNRQQIENQRKDINLKEFQKLSEWVSGAHLPEIKTVSKTTQKSSLKDGEEITEQTTEQSEEYAKKPDTAHFDTFSKRDGAVALQISAIYNLLPFFRGDYGESFRRPAFNLLKSAWQAMQQESLDQLRVDNLSDEAQKNIFNELQEKANSPMGVALTHVLLSLDQENKKLNLQDFPEMLINICLAGMNFQLNDVFKTKSHLSSLDLSGADFRAAEFTEAQLQKAILTKADLQGANLDFADLQGADLQGADLQGAKLQGAKLYVAKLQGADLQGADLQGANLQFAKLQNAYFNWLQLKHSKAQLFAAQITVNDFIQKIYPDWKKADDSKWTDLTKDEQTKTMQQFCDETKMLIFDENGKQQIMPPL